MDKKTYGITKRKLETSKEYIWEELKKTTRKNKDLLRCQRLLNMVDQLDNLICELIDWCEPEK